MRLAVCLLLTLAACGRDPTPRVVPDHGRQGGGETIRIEGGDGFAGHGPPVVYVGNRAAKMVVIESDDLLTFMTPQTDEVATVDIRVDYRDGTVLEIPAAFTYEAQEGIVLQPEIGF